MYVVLPVHCMQLGVGGLTCSKLLLSFLSKIVYPSLFGVRASLLYQ